MAIKWGEDASALVVYRANGRIANLVRGQDENGGTVWREAKEPMSGGQPAQPVKGGEALTPQELLEALRGPLGAG
jgi:hypothetical protein